MKTLIALLLLWLVVCLVPGHSQAAQKKNPDRSQPDTHWPSSGPLTWMSSDVNPKTVFWIQGRFVPVDNAANQGDAEVATILCSVREQECMEIDNTLVPPQSEQTWIQEFKAVNWDSSHMVATSRSLDGCTDEMLKIRFSPPSVVLINSPVLPMSAYCKKGNQLWDRLTGEKGNATAAQTEQDMLVPTRGGIPFQDWGPSPENRESSKPASQNKP